MAFFYPYYMYIYTNVMSLVDVSPFASPKRKSKRIEDKLLLLAQMANILRRSAPCVRYGFATSSFSKRKSRPPCMRLIAGRDSVRLKMKKWKGRISLCGSSRGEIVRV